MPVNIREKVLSFFYQIWFLWGLSLVFNIITFLFVFFKIGPGSRELALHYNVIAGVEWYGNGMNLYLIPGVGLAIWIINLILYKKIKEDRVFFAPLCVFITLLAEITLLAASIFLSTVN